MQKPLFTHYIAEILGVKKRRRRVERKEIGVAVVERANGLELALEFGFNVGVVVNVRPEKATLSETEGVPAGERDEVFNVEALVLKGGDEAWQVQRWRRYVGVGGCYVGVGGVAPS